LLPEVGAIRPHNSARATVPVPFAPMICAIDCGVPALSHFSDTALTVCSEKPTCATRAELVRPAVIVRSVRSLEVAPFAVASAVPFASNVADI
jgi:hypothetical protein